MSNKMMLYKLVVLGDGGVGKVRLETRLYRLPLTRRLP